MDETKYIWTDHALQRLKERKIAETLLIKTLTWPDKRIRRENHAIEFQKKIDARTVAVIVKKNVRGENVIVSCWTNPPFPGTKDFRLRNRYIKIRKETGLKKLWHMVLYRLNI